MNIFKEKRPEVTIEWASKTFKEGLVMTSSLGADSALMLHMASDVVPGIPVILINTGYLFLETHEFILRLTERFKLNLKIFSSGNTPVNFENHFGRLWEQGEEGVRKYLNIQKVLPMKNALAKLGATAVISGIRADQTEDRSKAEIVDLKSDGVFRISPILHWTKDDVEWYFKKHNLPKHPLVAKGYESIGDTHSTLPGKGREGRNLGVKQECGIHLDPEYHI